MIIIIITSVVMMININFTLKMSPKVIHIFQQRSNFCVSKKSEKKQQQVRHVGNSLKSWWFTRDPYNGLWNDPYKKPG